MLPESLRRLAFPVVGAMALALVTTTSALAQGSTGKIQGRVVDAQTGQPIAAASIEVVGTNRGNITNDDGYYFINDVPAGLVDIRASSIGYGPVLVNEQRVLAGQTHTQNFSLTQTAVELVEIVVEGDRNPLVPRDQLTSRSIVTGETIDELPIDNASSIVALQPGVITTNQGITIRGSRPNEQATYVDGVLVRRFQSGDADPLELPTNALAQVDVTTGGISARFADAQAGVVNYTTRSGASELGGAASYQTDALGPSDWRTGFHRGELSVGGPLFFGLDFFLAGTAEGRKYGVIAPGTDLFVATGVDTTFMVPTSDPGPTGLVDSVEVAFPTFERWNNGPTNPFDQSDEYNIAARLGYPIGNGSNVNLSYYRNRNQQVTRCMTCASSELFNPQGWDGSLNTADVVTLGGYFVLMQSASQAIALDVKASYQHFMDQFGVVDPTWLADHEDPALGFNFSTIDFIADPDDYPVTDAFVRAVRAGVALPPEMYQIFPGRLDLADRQTVTGVDAPLRLNPWGINSGLPISGFGGIAGALGTGTTGLEYLEETDIALNASLDWQAGRYNRIFVGGDYVDISVDRNFIGLFDGAASPASNDPIRAGFFLQDRLDLGDVVLEGGIRMDYFDPNSHFPRVPGHIFNVPDSLKGDAFTLEPGEGDPLDRLVPVEDCGGAATEDFRRRPDGTLVCKNNFIAAETKTEWSPRLAVSFPVTATSTFRLSYSHNVQVPALQQSTFGGQAAAAGQTALFSDIYADLNSPLANTNSRFGRDIDLPRTVLFEAGYRRLFGESTVFDVAAYSKTVRNGLTYRRPTFTDPVTGAPKPINVLTNADYSLTRGFDVRLDQRVGEIADLSLNYSYIDARGTGSDPLTYTGLILRGSSNLEGVLAPPEVMFPLEQSRTHNFSGTLSILLPDDFDMAAFSDVGVFATFSAASGLPFTRLVNAGAGQTGPPVNAVGLSATIAEQINASETPWVRTFDLRVHKGFQVAGTRMRAFADWRNPFDIENVSTVFLETGTTVNDLDRATEISGHLVSQRLDGDTNVDDFFVQCVGESDDWNIPTGGSATCDVPDTEPLVNAYSLQEAEARWGDGDGEFTVDEQERAFGAWYEALRAGEQFFRRSDQSLRLGVEVVF